MGDILAIAGVVVIGLVILIMKGIYYLLRALYRVMSGDARREEGRKQRLSEAKAEFERALLNRQFPSEDVLAVLADSDSYRDIDGNCEDDEIPQSLWDRLGYRISYPEAVKRVRKELQADGERKRTTAEYADVVHRFAALGASCSKSWDEIMQTMRALGGDGFQSRSFASAVEHDVLQALAAVCIANGGNVPDAMGRLCQSVLAQAKPEEYLTIEDCISALRRVEHKPVTLPIAVTVLNRYPTMMRTPTSANTVVASAYCVLMVAASACCPSSGPVAAVAAMYFDLLKPYLAGEDSSRSGSGNGGGNGSATRANSYCGKCVKYYPVLRLQSDASEEEIKVARRDLAQIYHPDRFGAMSVRLRQRAEEQLKEVNEAYAHIIGHFDVERQNRPEDRR